MIRVLMLVFLYSFLTYAQFVPMSIDTKKPKKYISSVDKMQLKPKYSDTNTKNGIKWSKEMIIVIKTGDLPPYYHNQVVSIIDSSTYRQLPDSLSLWMRTVYRMETHELKDRAKFREAIDSNIVWMADSTGNNNRYLMDDSYVELATIKNKYKEKNQPVDILKATKYKAKDYLILDTDVTDNDPVVDSNAITAGTYTVGPTGDYAGLEAANADVGSGTIRACFAGFGFILKFARDAISLAVDEGFGFIVVHLRLSTYKSFICIYEVDVCGVSHSVQRILIAL